MACSSNGKVDKVPSDIGDAPPEGHTDAHSVADPEPTAVGAAAAIAADAAVFASMSTKVDDFLARHENS